MLLIALDSSLALSSLKEVIRFCSISWISFSRRSFLRQWEFRDLIIFSFRFLRQKRIRRSLGIWLFVCPGHDLNFGQFWLTILRTWELKICIASSLFLSRNNSSQFTWRRESTIFSTFVWFRLNNARVVGVSALERCGAMLRGWLYAVVQEIISWSEIEDL